MTDPTAIKPDDATGPVDRPVLVVDLDGTLIKTDMLHETFWSAVSIDPRAISGSIAALQKGKPALKAYLAERATVDPTSLPYDDRVLERVRDWRASGGRTALVTATDARLATAIADHLDLFDEVHGTSPETNLKGTAKADFLKDRFGQSGYIYMGDSAADLPVWAGAAKAVTVGADARIRRTLDTGSTPVEHLPRSDDLLAALFRALRPHQWLKNVLVFIPLIASRAFSVSELLAAFVAFVSLSLIASAGYILNDLLDLGDDRSHPRKRLRPFASGALSASIGTLAVPSLLALGFGLALLHSPILLLVMLTYFVATTAYSVKLKRHAMVDICMLAVLFTLRIIAGGVAINTQLSVWLLAFSMFIFFALAAVKRLAELTDTETADRAASRRGYRTGDLPVISQMAVTSGYLAVLVFALYINDPIVQENFGTPWLLWGVCPLMIFWVSRLVLVAMRGEMHDDPLIWTLQNKTSRKVVIFVTILVAGAVLL